MGFGVSSGEVQDYADNAFSLAMTILDTFYAYKSRRFSSRIKILLEVGNWVLLIILGMTMVVVM